MYAICVVPVAPIRLRPDHREEMTTQYIFGEVASIADQTNDGWVKLVSQYDQYPGWCRSNQFFISGERPPSTAHYTADWINDIEVNGMKIRVPFGSNLDILQFNEAGLTVRYAGPVLDATVSVFNPKTMLDISHMFLGTAYLWGGRSVFGIDCSGFVQTVFRMMNIQLLRDANQQVKQGSAVGFLQEAVCGDLAFFDDDAGEIVHVGMLLNDHQIIHASGDVRIDHIDHSGIIHSVTGKRTHRLRTIRRMA